MSIDNQAKYWNRVAHSKTFSHPLNLKVLSNYVQTTDYIIDFGCGYGRLIKLLKEYHFQNVTGFDTSKELISRGLSEGVSSIFHIDEAECLPIENNSVACFLLFAVLTCIPSNQAQKDLLKILHSGLKTNGIIYISDYSIQEDPESVKRYEYLNGDPDNYGVFTLPEGVTFRHHTREWIAELLKDFTITEEFMIDIQTMNGNNAKAFQIIAKK